MYGGGGSTSIYNGSYAIISAAGGYGQGEKRTDTTVFSSSSSTRIDARTYYYNRFGVYVANITPIYSGTLNFRSTSYTADPYAFIDDINGNNLKSNDDSGGGNLNFNISYSVSSGTTYRLRIGSYSQTLSTIENTVWYATFPTSNVHLERNGYYKGGLGGGSSYCRSINNLIINNCSFINNVNSGNGKIIIMKLYPKSTKCIRKRHSKIFPMIIL